MKRTIPIGKSRSPTPSGSEPPLPRQDLIMARDLTRDLLKIHRGNLDALTKAIEKPGMLLDEDDIPHKVMLDTISALQKDILTASTTLLKLEEALTTQNKRTSSRIEGKAIANTDKPVDVSAIVLELTSNQAEE